jgi:hypothetical protein
MGAPAVAVVPAEAALQVALEEPQVAEPAVWQVAVALRVLRAAVARRVLRAQAERRTRLTARWT